ncbi:hypothetical protein N7450_004770 [Penicillium hetheringtonii]|uniref:Uncharacterized protein n=1 Tax=Penicillium hetheringtonii TaxID=911720 RepID=A0AAD6DQM3_9EURO|nr:hypothetical protein N7450_004770 [Penicillium hetheringtonii]
MLRRSKTTLYSVWSRGRSRRRDLSHPAAAVWMDIMGEDICLWSSRNFGDNGRSGFELHKWREWKRGFETCSNSDRLHPQAQGQAERAYSKMKTLETAATCY